MRKKREKNKEKLLFGTEKKLNNTAELIIKKEVLSCPVSVANQSVFGFLFVET